MERDDLFTMTHKGLRHGLFSVAQQAGTTEYGDPGAFAALRATWSRLERLLRAHSRQEDEHVLPLVSSKIPGGAVDLAREHTEIRAALDGLAAQVTTIGEEAEVEERRVLGLGFYRAVQRLLVTVLPHLDDEETVLMPRLRATCSEEEIARVRAGLSNALGPEETQHLFGLMLQAVNPVEREALLDRVPGTGGREG
ncbi:MAG: hemerythrin domain-containing protein [Acidimicrobiia bacterium]|nr:hemerythrin domain-containing protein [Acidimicrobiia bacterium]